MKKSKDSSFYSEHSLDDDNEKCSDEKKFDKTLSQNKSINNISENKPRFAISHKLRTSKN